MNGWKITVALVSLWLTACDADNELQHHFQTYLTRVAHVLETTPPALSPPPPLPPFPAQRQLQQLPPRISAGLLDTLKLGQCQLLSLVGEHNSPLGRTRGAASQLIYHLQFQQGLQDCIAHPDTDRQLLGWLHKLEQQKAPLLVLYHWNMMVSEPEIRAVLTPRQRILPFAEQAGFHATLAAFELFERLRHIAQGKSVQLPIGEQQVNRVLSGLYGNDYLGQLFYSLHASTHYLRQSMVFLQQLADVDCGPSGRAGAERLRNAMQHYYIKDIQGYFSRIDRQFVELAPLISASLQAPRARTEIIAAYRAQMAAGLQSVLYLEYRQNVLEHARLWQQFLTRCDISPT
ncbi:DUF3080 family protein [Zobellella maritima]|uniref:DUF3080 family protein n=1 Tax=Zobellella maritima TaxID=2059725 RepID=UPI000E303AB5|nr:DUF3080 family protein [Zobellella maritima]